DYVRVMRASGWSAGRGGACRRGLRRRGLRWGGLRRPGGGHLALSEDLTLAPAGGVGVAGIAVDELAVGRGRLRPLPQLEQPIGALDQRGGRPGGDGRLGR